MENLENLILNEIMDDEDASEEEDELDEEDGAEDLLVHQVLLHAQDLVNAADAIPNAMENAGIDHNLLLYADPPNRDHVLNLHYFDVIIPQYNDGQFYSHFRMNREIYTELENLIGPRIGEDILIPPRKKILMTIWIVATPESFRSVADRFGLTKSRAHGIFKEIIGILNDMMPQFIRWPNVDECDESERVFRVRSRGFPGVVGAIDGCHIAIKQPPGNANDYYNRKEFHSVVLQGVCDHTGKFIDCLIGRPGRAHDAAIFRSSIVYAKLMDPDNPLLPPQRHLLGDSAYPLLQNVMTPFRDNGHLTQAQFTYNTRLSSIRSIIERAYALPKGKWRRLKYLDVQSVEQANHIIAAACTLHNFLLIHNPANIRENHNFDNNMANVDDNVPEDGNDNDVRDENINGRIKRQDIMNNL